MTLNSGRLFTENRHLVTISSNFCEDPNDYQNQLNKARQDLIICPNLSQRRNTKQIILTSIATKNKNIRERHLTIDKRETKQKKSIFDTGEKDNKHTKLSCNEKFKKNANYIMDLPITIILMSILTLFALFLSDIQTAWCPPSVDLPFDIIQLFVFISFTIEICLCTYVDPSYGLSLFFWLDIISTLSLFLDVNFISDHFLGTKIFIGNTKYKYQLALSKISTASGTTRVLRVLRIVKLIRVVKLYKQVYQAKTKMVKAEEMKKKKIKMLLLNNSNKSNTDSSIPDSEEKMNTSGGGETSSSKKGSTETGKKPTVPRMKQSFKVVHLMEDEESEKKVKDDFGKVQKINDVSDETLKESRISKTLTDSLNKKIFCLVMIVLIIYPFLCDDFYITSTESISYTVLGSYLESYYLINEKTFNRVFDKYISSSMDSFFPIINITLNGSLVYKNPNITKTNFRNDEVSVYVSPNTLIEITFSMFKSTTLNATLNFFRTLFVCVLVTMSVWFIEGDAKENVLEPLEIMMEIIDKVSSDPANAKNINQIQSGTKATIEKFEGKKVENNYEIKVIKQSIIKLSALLSMGFGEIGAEIVKNNLINDSYNFKERGKMIAGIYGYFNLRNFSTINKQFKKNSIILINHIAEIIHDSVAMYGGIITKNCGESILTIWKFTSNNFILSNNEQIITTTPNASNKLLPHLDSKDAPRKQFSIRNKSTSSKTLSLKHNKTLNQITGNHRSSKDLTVLMENITDLSILSALRVFHKIQKNSNAYFTNPAHKISIGFSFHLGYSIEGVVGSSLKIDTVHLSRNTTLNQKINEYSSYYGVDFIFTDTVYKNMSDSLKRFCRVIDNVNFTSISKSYKLYTIDVNQKLTISNKSHIYLTRYEKELLHAEKVKKLYEQINNVGNVSAYILSRHSFQEVLDSGYTEEFYTHWKHGFEFYEEGDWSKAKDEFGECSKMIPNDGPCNRLMEYMNEYNYEAPSYWEGHRTLSE